MIVVFELGPHDAQRYNQSVVEPLMIAFKMIMIRAFAQRAHEVRRRRILGSRVAAGAVRRGCVYSGASN